MMRIVIIIMMIIIIMMMMIIIIIIIMMILIVLKRFIAQLFQEMMKSALHHFLITILLRVHQNIYTSKGFYCLAVHLSFIVIFLGQFCPRGKGAMRLTVCEAPTRETRQINGTMITV